MASLLSLHLLSLPHPCGLDHGQRVGRENGQWMEGRRCLAQGLIQSVAASPSAFIGLFVINVSRALKLFWSAEFGVALSGLFWVVVYFETVVFQK